jgi:hypothetical protein
MARLVVALIAVLFALVVLLSAAPAAQAQTYQQASYNAAAALEADLDARFAQVLAAINALQLSCQGQANVTPSPSRAAAPTATPSPSRAAAPSPSSTPSRSPAAPSASSSPATGLRSVTVGPGQTFTEPADAIASLASGFNMTVLAGTYYKPFDIPNTLRGWTINGAGGGRTIFDGQGGVGAGHRLAWGKGFVHTQSPGTLSNIVFQNAGGADGSGDGEAAVYAELFSSAGTLTINRCLFQNNENGIFVPAGGSGKPGAGIAVVVTNSDFIANGQSKDGQSHDLYVQGDSYTESNCNHYGNPYGNNIKVRSPVLSVTGGYHANTAGSRWIDFPNGGTATVNGGTFTIPSTSGGGNVIGYAEENQNNGVTGGMAFSGSAKLYIGRYNTQINVATGGTVSFASTVSLTWTSSGASISVTNGGSVTGIAFAPGSSTIGSEPAVPARVSGN